MARHEAQECFCGEPNCVGFLGGKTQTDVGAMDDLYLDGAYLCSGLPSWPRLTLWTALGIADDVEAMSLKGTKNKKGKKMDIDYMVRRTGSWRAQLAHPPAAAHHEADPDQGRAQGCLCGPAVVLEPAYPHKAPAENPRASSPAALGSRHGQSLMVVVQITEDEAVQRQLMRLHGFSLMSMVLNEYIGDEEVIKGVRRSLLVPRRSRSDWPSRCSRSC